MVFMANLEHLAIDSSNYLPYDVADHFSMSSPDIFSKKDSAAEPSAAFMKNDFFGTT